MMLQQIRHITPALVWTNRLFLLCIVLLLFTALVAEHLTHPGAPVAVAIYAGGNALTSLIYLPLYQVSQRHFTEASTNLRLASVGAGLAICSAAVALAFVTPVASLLLVAAIWLWWSPPDAGRRARG